MLVPIVLIVGTKYCLQTNYGDVVKFIAVQSFNFLSVHVKYLYSTLALNMHLPLDFILVSSVVSVSCPYTELRERVYLRSCFGTKIHCLPTNCGNLL